MSCEVKICMFVRNKSVIFISSVKKVISSESGEKYAQIKHSLQLKTVQIIFLQTCRFSLHKTLIDGLEWCGLLMDYCDVFISCFCSFWRHPFTAEHPLVSKWCNAKYLQICSQEKWICDLHWTVHVYWVFIASLHTSLMWICNRWWELNSYSFHFIYVKRHKQ